MKKLLYVLLTLVFILVNIFGYSLMSNKQLTSVLYPKYQIVHFDYSKATSNIENAKLIDHLVKFSKDTKINISQYNFLSESDLNIYSTNIKDDSRIHIETGELPKSNQYISNENIDDSTTKQSGIFSLPLSKWKIRFYDIQQVKNVGLGNEFYIIGAEKEIVNAFIKEFSIYGNISLLHEKVSSLELMNIPLLMVVIFSFVLFFIGMFYFLVSNRKALLLEQLWGYSESLILFSVPKRFLRFCITLQCLILFGYIIFIICFKQTYFLLDYIMMFTLTNIVTIIILLLFTLFGTWLIQKFNDSSLNVKGKLPFERIQLMSAILKALIAIILFSLISFSLSNYYQLSKKVDSFRYWNETKDVFKVQVGNLDDDIDSNLEKDRELNDRLFTFYKEIESNNNAFLMESENFNVMNYDVKGNPIYSYTLNAFGEEEIYSPHGRKVTINKNYLNVNAIKSSNGIPIEIQVKDDKDILNILVPEQFRDRENQIVESYKEWFYFQKVEVDNIYNEELGFPLNKKKIDDLKINIIYTKPGQDYFTFDSFTGNSQNKIRDPIAVIYNESVDTSNIGAYTTTSLFYLDTSQGRAYENILPSITKAKVPEIKNAISVYSEANEEIVKQQWLLFQQVVGLILTIIFSAILFLSFIWAYYSANVYQLSLRYVFGYSYWKRNKKIILFTVISNILSGLLVYFVFSVTLVLVIIGCVLIIELVVINIIGNNLNQKNMKKVLKGDHV